MAYRAFLVGRNAGEFTSCYCLCENGEIDSKAHAGDQHLGECDVRKMRDVLRERS